MGAAQCSSLFYLPGHAATHFQLLSESMSDCVVSAAATDAARCACCGGSGVMPISCIRTRSYSALRAAFSIQLEHYDVALQAHSTGDGSESHANACLLTTAFALHCRARSDWSSQRMLQRADNSDSGRRFTASRRAWRAGSRR